jgi:type II secretory pathway component HofQ
VRKRCPVLIGETLQALVNKDMFRSQLDDAVRRGWIEINSRPQGIVQNGATLDLSSGSHIPVTIPDGHALTGTVTTVMTAGRRLVATPLVTLHGIELKFSITDDQIVSGLDVVDRRSVEGTVILRQNEIAIVGGFRASSGGQLRLYSVEAASIEF